MPVVWCSVSSHGFGHAAQVVPVLNELGRRVRHLRAILRTTVDAAFFTGRLKIPWEISHAAQDIGCVQHGPLQIDIPATWEAHRQFHADWESRVAMEAEAIRTARPAMVLSNISHLAVAAGSAAGIPVLGCCSLSWDHILEGLRDTEARPRAEADAVIQHVRGAYALADVMIRPEPGCPMNAFKHVRDVGPIAQAAVPEPQRLRTALGASTDEPIVLVGFGGIALKSFPVSRLNELAPYRFIVDRMDGHVDSRVRSIASMDMSFGTLLASADILLTKPGYSTVVEAVAHQRAVIYVRRYNFADESPLVTYLHQHARAVELSQPDFLEGQWGTALTAVQELPCPARNGPRPHGASEAADIIEEYMK